MDKTQMQGIEKLKNVRMQVKSASMRSGLSSEFD